MCKRNMKYVFSVLIAAMMVCSLCGCGSRKDDNQSVGEPETANVQSIDVQESDVQPTDAQPIARDELQGAQSGEDLDVVEPDTADDNWYMDGNVYTDDNGRKLEVFFNDEGMLEFAVDGLSMYYSTVDNFQQENNWKIYTCDDGTVIIYYPGTPAYLEISDGEYAGLYKADDSI